MTSLSVRYPTLDIWAGTSGFKIDHPTGSIYPVRIEYSLPEPVEAELPNGMSVGVCFSVEGPTCPPRSEVHVVQRAWMVVKGKESHNYDDLLRMSRQLADLVALAVGVPLHALEITGTCDARVHGSDVTKPTKVTIVDSRLPMARENAEVAAGDMLFTLSHVRDRFPDLVRTWLSRRAEILPLYDLYFATLQSSAMYVEHRFLNMFQALESYDRRTRTSTPDQDKPHQERIERIFCTIQDKKDAQWLKGKLRHSNEPAAKQRIQDLTEQNDAAWLLDAKSIELAANFRNYYTHFDTKLEAHLPPESDRIPSMHNLAVRLQVLCEVILLRLLGFQDIRQRLEVAQRVSRLGGQESA